MIGPPPPAVVESLKSSRCHLGNPAGVPGLKPSARLHLGRPFADLSDVLVTRPRPWLLDIWEPLHTKAPSPPKAAPFCCYINTVIFYHFPHIVPPWGTPWKSNGRWNMVRSSFVEWDRIESRLTWDAPVEFEGEMFLIGGGRVVWRRNAWWMLRGARRQSR